MATHTETVLVDISNDLLKQQQTQPLTRQSSIYSLTLDEFQNTLCEPGKNFGSMNMDEFLTNIWTAEESQAVAAAMGAIQSNHNNDISEKILTGSSNLHRQGSLSIPAPLCQKTVDEVWSDIRREEVEQNGGNPGKTPREPTFGEMTLEDFLIKAGVVREGFAPPSPQQQYTMPTETQTFGHMGFGEHRNTGNGVSGGGIPSYQGLTGGFPAGCYGGRMGNGGFAAQPLSAVGCGSPVSPVSSDGMGVSQVDNAVVHYDLDMGGMRGRKRIIDGPVEKVVERRQRRMIKNRESAARSRARKQAYTVELEAELNQLKEENARLKKEQKEAEEKRRKKLLESMKEKALQKMVGLKKLRRTYSTAW